MEVVKLPLFSRKMEEVSVFINTAHLYLNIKIIRKPEATKMAWILSYVQRGAVEA